MQTASSLDRKVNLIGVKRFALETLHEGTLRDDILSQPDELTPEQYIANRRVWLRLVRLGGKLEHGPPVGQAPYPLPSSRFKLGEI